MFLPALSNFFAVIASDNRISVNHVSLYMALFEVWNRNDFINPVSITRRDIMLTAKITRTVYHRCIKELHDYGYIRYIPSFHPILGSIVYLQSLSFQKESHALLYT